MTVKTSKVFFWVALPILLAGLVVLSFVFSLKQKPQQHSTNSGNFDSAAHPLIYYEEKPFWQGVAVTESTDGSLPKGALGGIMPHHLFPGFILSDFFKRWQKNPPTTVILVGPNHKEKGIYKILTSLHGWKTPFGVVEPKTEILTKLTQSGLVNINESVVEDEHSVAGMMPYIKYYLPNAKVVPLVLRSTLNLDDVNNLANAIAPMLDGNTVLFAPVDFSHYLTSEKAAANDQVTWKAIQDFDLRKILSFNNDYVDGPTSIAVFLKTMQLSGKKSIQKLYNTNSGIIENNPYEQSTSYFSLIFY